MVGRGKWGWVWLCAYSSSSCSSAVSLVRHFCMQIYVAKRDNAKTMFKQALDAMGGEIQVRRRLAAALQSVSLPRPFPSGGWR